MKRVLLFILGAILLVVGLVFAGVGGTLASIVGPSGEVSTEVGKVSGDGYALVLNEFTINTVVNADAVDGMGEFTVNAKTLTSNQIFLGIGRSSDVNDYLSGSARDVVSDITGGSSRVVPIPGPKVPGSPASQDFWLAQAQGSTPKIPLEKSGPGTTLVVMNVVPAKPVAADMSLGMTSSTLFPVGLGLLILGVLLIVLSVFVFVRAIRGKKRPPVPPTTAPVGSSPLGAYAATPPGPAAQTPGMSVPPSATPAPAAGPEAPTTVQPPVPQPPPATPPTT